MDAYPMVATCAKHQPLYHVGTCPRCRQEKPFKVGLCITCEIKAELAKRNE